MKRFFSILATVAVATMTLVGCDKDNDKDAVKWEENGIQQDVRLCVHRPV